MKTLLIAGTNTEVGKTIATAALAAYNLVYRPTQTLGLIKLIQTGSLGDRQFYHQLFASSSGVEIATPLCFEAPLAPPIAAAKEGKNVDLKPVWQTLSRLGDQHDWTIAEALGGLGSPVTAELTVADLARDWRLPTLLVVPVELGAIAATVANAAYAQSCSLNLVGIVLNCVQPKTAGEIEDLTPVELIQTLTGIPVIGCLPYLESIELNQLADAAANLDLELILPSVRG